MAGPYATEAGLGALIGNTAGDNSYYDWASRIGAYVTGAQNAGFSTEQILSNAEAAWNAGKEPTVTGSTVGSGGDETGPYIGFPSMQGAQNRANEAAENAAANESSGIFGKIQGFIASAGLIIVGAGIVIVAVYFAAKKVGES